MTWKKPFAGSDSNLNNNVYTIELSRWGITQGFPTKPYVDADYIRADANIQGINNALAWAHANGYNYLIMPTGNYPICYPRRITITQDNLTLDLNRSTFKVIFNSDAKSPFDTVNDGTLNKEYWRFDGKSFSLDSVRNSHICNGYIIGCRADRSFADPNERKAEHTYGIEFTGMTSFSTVHDLEISFYMGDSINFPGTSPTAYGEFNDMNSVIGDIDLTNGSLIPNGSSKNMYSRLLPIITTTRFPTPNRFKYLSIQGPGYARATGIIDKEVGVFFYNAQGNYVAGFSQKKVFSHVTIPPNATQYRLQFYNDIDTTKNSTSMGITIKYGADAHHNRVYNCEIFANGRGGITPGGSYNIIENCIFRDFGVSNPEGQANDLYGKPTFNYDGTKYGINQEDAFGDNTIIRDCTFHGLWHAILIRGYNFIVENNRIFNCAASGINIYETHRGSVRGNYIFRSAQPLGVMSGSISNAHVEFSDNTIIGGNISLGAGNGYDIAFINNTIIDAPFVTIGAAGFNQTQLTNINSDIVTTNVVSCHFKYTLNYTGTPQINIDRMQNCTFEKRGSSSKQSVLLRCKQHEGTVFNNMKIMFNTREQSVKRETVTVVNSKFWLSQLVNEISSDMKGRKLIIKDSELNDSWIEQNNVNSANEQLHLDMQDSKWNLSSAATQQYLLHNGNSQNAPASMYEINRCKIEIANVNLLRILNGQTLGGTPPHSIVTIRDSELVCTDANPLSLAYHSGTTSVIKSFATHRSIFKNLNMTGGGHATFFNYDPISHGIAEPTNGNWFKGDTSRNVNAVNAGDPVGWDCITTGVANNVSWAASTVKRAYDRINSGGYVYECIVGGTTDATSPTFPTGVWTTVTETGGVKWQNIGAKAAFRTYGVLT